MLEEQHPATSWNNFYPPPLVKPAVERGRSALQLTFGVIQVQVEGEVRPLRVVRSFVCTITMCFSSQLRFLALS